MRFPLEAIPAQLTLPPTSRPVGCESPEAVNDPAVWVATLKLAEPKVRLPPSATGPVMTDAFSAAFPFTNTVNPLLPVTGL